MSLFYSHLHKSKVILRLVLACLLWGAALTATAGYPYYLQVGQYEKKGNAEQFLKSIQTHSPYPAAVREMQMPNKKVYQVVIQGFHDQTELRTFQATLHKDGVDSLVKKQSQLDDHYEFAPSPVVEATQTEKTQTDINNAIEDPEYLLKHDVHFRMAPTINNEAPFFLSLRDAIYLSLRYNTQLQSTELDRIVQRYSVRMAKNKFEFQYALDGAGNWNWAKDLGVNKSTTNSLNLTPSIKKKTRFGTEASVGLMNNYDNYSYAPQLTLNVKQPLLRGFGKTFNEQSLNDQLDDELSNQMGMKQAVIDRITDVIMAYRSLIQQNNSLDTQKQSLKEAKKTYWINEKNIKAGTLSPKGNIQQAFQVSYIESNLESQENTLIQAKQRLLTAIGLDPNMNVKVPSDVAIEKLLVPDLKQTQKKALANNTSYQQAIVSYRKTKRAYEVMKNKKRWQLDFNASVTTGGSAISNADSSIKRILTLRNNGAFNAFINRLFNEGTNGEQLGLTFSIPIKDLSLRSEMIAAKVTLEKSRLQLLALKRKLETDVINSINSIRTQVRLYNMNLKQVALAKESYELELKRQEAGIASSIDVTNTQNQLISARNNLIGAKISYLDEITKLEQMLGTTLEVWKMDIRFLE